VTKKEYSKAYYKIYHQTHKAQNKNRAYRNRDKNMEWFLSFLGTSKLHCNRCKYDKSSAALQMHHTNTNQKVSKIDQFSYWLKTMGLKSFQDKILKTDFEILCANCHAELHEELRKNGEYQITSCP